MKTQLVTLIIMDGWGVAPPGPGNAITQSKTPNITKFWSAYPHTQLLASGEAVGLPRGQVGNTETGHLNLGAGQIVYQDLARINMAIANGSFFRNETLLQAIEHARKNKSKLHIMGLLGAGGVHSNMEHLFALTKLCSQQRADKVFLHLFTDGRDSPPTAAIDYLKQVEDVIKVEGAAKIATLIGRYYAMDRDLRWDRTEQAYFGLTKGTGKYITNPTEAIQKSYDENTTDEFIPPQTVTQNGKPIALIEENDTVIFFNFRIDRPRQLTRAFVLDDFEKEAEKLAFSFNPYDEGRVKKNQENQKRTPVFKRGPKIKNLFFVTMTKYEDYPEGHANIAFPPVRVKLPLSAVVSTRNIRQLKLAESEKERFVTFYFNGQQELIYPGEERKIIPSPKVPTYDKAPEMSAREITKTFCQTVGHNNSGNYSFVLINFANPDMVGHTGDLQATKIAISTVDECVGKIVETVNQLDGITIITADHGNAEELLTPDGKTDTEHNNNPVPFLIVGKRFIGNPRTLQSGILADVAPTILKLLEIKQPSEMTGQSLI